MGEISTDFFVSEWTYNLDGIVATQEKEDGMILAYAYDDAARLSEIRLGRFNPRQSISLLEPL